MISQQNDKQNKPAKKKELTAKQALARASLASFIGNFVEWFDYAVYGYLASTMAVVFFPTTDKRTGLMAAFAVFAISFIIRPIGGVIWGHFGDKIGRRNVLSFSILLMSGATFCIALLPGYASIGVLSPILLVLIRLVQGFSASGEYAGASSFLSEYAPNGKRGLYTCLVPASSATGLLFGSLCVYALHAYLSDTQINEWGWRIPFLLAAPFGLIGRYIRLHLEDTPKFRRLQKARPAQKQDEKIPLQKLMKHWRTLAVACGIVCLNAVAFYLLLSYMPTYLISEQGMSETDSFKASSVSLVTYIGCIFMMGHLSDIYGRKRMLMLASIFFILFSIPLFMLLSSKNFMVIVFAQIAFGFILSMNDGTLACYLTEIFPTKIRYSGFALSFNVSNAIFGGTAPLIATKLIAVSESSIAPAWYLTIAAIVALIAILRSHETAHKELID